MSGPNLKPSDERNTAAAVRVRACLDDSYRDAGATQVEDKVRALFQKLGCVGGIARSGGESNPEMATEYDLIAMEALYADIMSISDARARVRSATAGAGSQATA